MKSIKTGFNKFCAMQPNWCYLMGSSDSHSLCVLHTRAWPIRFFWVDTNVFQFSLPISDIFVLLKQSLFCLMRQNNTPGALLPSAKHFQTTAERHYSGYFSSGHINKENNFTNYNHFMRQDIHSCFALWGKIYTLGAILPLAQHDWLKWSHDKFGLLDFLS